MTIIPISKDFSQAKAILRDSQLKANPDIHDKNTILQLKLLEAREENLNFELELAERICGDNKNYPYRSSYYLTRFFQDLGFNYTHDGLTRRIWVREVLLELDVSQLSYIIKTGLFRKKDYKNLSIRPAEKKGLPENEFLEGAIQDFRCFIDESINANETIDIDQVLNLNINLDLLIENASSTKDEELINLINEARERFLKPGDQNIALEKLWDAFERMKTYFDHDKRKSTTRLIKLMSIDLDTAIFEAEFETLTAIGNSYRIRHHETDKKPIITDNQIKYLFFRMLSLIYLGLEVLKEPKP